jgi:hypothetical protein
MDRPESVRPNVTYNITINLPSPTEFDRQHPNREHFRIWVWSIWRLIVNWFTLHHS